MNECSVLRCTARAAHEMYVAPADLGVYKSAVCDQHKHEIDAGAEWSYDAADRTVYMGQDLAVTSHHVVHKIRLSQLETLMPDLGEVPIIATFACRTRGSHERHTVSLVLTNETATNLIDALRRFVAVDHSADLREPKPNEE